jgi:hypothetical protein
MENNNNEENVGVDFGLFGFVDFDDLEDMSIDTSFLVDSVNYTQNNGQT